MNKPKLLNYFLIVMSCYCPLFSESGVLNIGFDIDDTVLFSRDVFLSIPSDKRDPIDYGWVNTHDDGLSLYIDPTVDLINYFITNGHNVFFITARAGTNGEALATFLSRGLALPIKKNKNLFFAPSEKIGGKSHTTKHRIMKRLKLDLFYGDGDSDIVVVCEWMAITVFKNQDGNFIKEEINTNLGCSSTGWWYSIEVGDLNNDKLPDLIVGNLGLNYKYKASVDEPFEVFYDDFDENGTKDIVLAYYNYGIQFPLRGFSCSSQQVPDLKDKFEKYDIFASLDVQEVYGEENLENALRLSVNTFESAALINNESFFDFKPLPNYAQFSSVNDIIIKDFDNDQINDLLIVGNMYHAEIETARNDAGNGLFLKGVGDGSFKEVSVSESGFFAPGDSKKIITLNLGNNDIILVANNNDRIQIFK